MENTLNIFNAINILNDHNIEVNESSNGGYFIHDHYIKDGVLAHDLIDVATLNTNKKMGDFLNY